ncbi:MAG: hypothetical protein IT426_11365 [Pirellulales bacterium]|nr:hypothetical protein [Pirellulales bacterium]
MTMPKLATIALMLCPWGATTFAAEPSAPADLESCNVVWTTPSKDAAGSMPLGNGELGLNLWIEENGDLQFYISRTDSLSEISQLVKLGKVRVSLAPNPFLGGAPFKQELRLREGRCEITGGEGEKRVKLTVFVDAERPVVHILGESASPLAVKASLETWRTARRALPNAEERSAWTMLQAPFDLYESADVFPDGIGDAVAMYHRNEESVVPNTIEHQSLQAAADKIADPLLHRTFGGWMAAPGFKAAEGHAIESPAAVKSFALRIAAPCAQTETAQAWLEMAKELAADSADAQDALRRTAAWWQAFWGRSWIFPSGDGGVDIPANKHPLRIGVDSNGQNRLPGYLSRAGVYDRALASEEIVQIVAAGREAESPVREGFQSLASAQGLDPGQYVKMARSGGNIDFAKGLTLETWFKPEGKNSGRLFDKITAGGSDGFLFDNVPGDSLRLIVGAATLDAPPGILKAGPWHHVAATVETATGEMRIYLDGKLVARRPGDTGSPLARSYTLQRYVQACGGRGTYPIKFNGSIFTVEPKAVGLPFSPDYRDWGDCHWWQNVRIPYHAMLASRDLDMMNPLFRMYEAVRPLCEARAKIYHDCEGCYFPETMTVWGLYSNQNYGWDRTGKKPSDVQCFSWRYAWNQGPELVALMLDRWDYTVDEKFLREEALPMAESVLRYFDARFRKDDRGKIVLDPTQAVETYAYDVINDAPTVAGLVAITARLRALPEKLTSPEQRAFFAKMKAACPAVPVEEEKHGGKLFRELAPAEKYAKRTSNCENPELYAIWPFRLYGLGKPDIEIARAAYAHRRNHLDAGWGYDGTCAALLGLTDEAARIMKVKCANSHPAYRWPATWGPNFDWLPDQDHGSSLLVMAQFMLLQCDGDKIMLLPAWPKDWDVSFKLHAPKNTTVECVYRRGKIEKLEVVPPEREKDVRAMAGSFPLPP